MAKPSGKRKRKKFHYEKVVKVHCANCPSFIDEKLVKFINIEEDIQGYDILTFECPQCNTEQKSKRFG